MAQGPSPYSHSVIAWGPKLCSTPTFCFLQPRICWDTCSLGMRNTRTQGELVTYVTCRETRVTRLFLSAKSGAQVT